MSSVGALHVADRLPPASLEMARPRSRREIGIRIVVLYKTAKAVVETGAVLDLIEQNSGGGWSVLIGRALATLVGPEGVHLLEIGLAIDAAMSAFEAWSLWRGYRWGSWLVTLATAIPLPFEAVEIVRQYQISRVALGLLNLVLVVYLMRRIRHGTAVNRAQ